MNFLDLRFLLPEIILCFGALLIILLDVMYPKAKKYWFGTVAYFITIISFGSLFFLSRKIEFLNLEPGKWLYFQDTFAIDGFAAFMKALLLFAGSIVILFSVTYVYKGRMQYKTEFFALLLFGIMSMLVLVSSTDLILIILAFEFVSISSYILVGYHKNDIKSREASVKYYFYGAVSAAILLMGFSFLYGITGETGIYQIAQAINNNTLLIPDFKWLALLSLVLIGAGFGFKVAMFPFQMWVPDVYEGAPTPVTAFLSVASKSAGMAVLLRFFFVVFSVKSYPVDWSVIFMVLSIVTMFLGNLMALNQNNIKRMLGYSSIAHVGYMLAGIVGLYSCNISPAGIDVSPILIYLMAYTYMNLGAFAVIILAEDMTSDEIPKYAGLARKAPLLSGMLTVFLLALVGIPVTAGFIGKLFVFGQIVSATYYVLAIIAVVNSVVSAYYYLRVVHYMYFTAPVDDVQSEYYSQLTLGALFVCLFATIIMGLFPNWIIVLAKSALIGILN